MSGATDTTATSPAPGRSFALFAALALALHSLLLFRDDGLRGGADLLPHLRIAQLALEDGPALRTVYAPAYHAFLALVSPWVGWEGAVESFALLGAALLLFGFRSFQRASGLPDASAALFASWPYLLALSWCAPKVEAAGYGLALFGLAQLWRSRFWAVAGLLFATFWVHTAAALMLGLVGGVASLARRDARGFAALAVGALLAAPLPAAHLAAGCTLPQAFLFSQGDYLRPEPLWSLAHWDVLLLLSNPLVVIAACVGGPGLVRRDRALALASGVIVVLYLNELWLAPFGRGTTLNLVRGLSLLAIPACAAAGVALESRPRWRNLALAIAAFWFVGTALLSLPRACFVRSIDPAEVGAVQVERCTFRWRAPPPPAPIAPAPRTGSR